MRAVDPVQLGENVRARRELAGYLPRTVACALNLSEADYLAVEAGRAYLLDNDLRLLAKLFGCRREDFF